MKQLNLRLYKDLTVNEDNELTVAVSMEDGNGLQILTGDHPGLYLELAQAISSGASVHCPEYLFDMSDIGVTNNFSMFMFTKEYALNHVIRQTSVVTTQWDLQIEMCAAYLSLNPSDTYNGLTIGDRYDNVVEECYYDIDFDMTTFPGPTFQLGRNYGSKPYPDDYIDKEKHKVYQSLHLNGRRLHASSQVHRVFTRDDPSVVTRFGIGEWVLPGDIYRHPEGDGTFTYYLIISVTGQRPLDTRDPNGILVKGGSKQRGCGTEATSGLENNRYQVIAKMGNNTRNYVREMIKLGRW